MEKPKILAQTDSYAVIFKPAGIATQLSDDKNESSLEFILKKSLEKEHIFFPHRLDRVTQGLLLIAFDKQTVAYFNSEIKNKRVDKFYLAKVETMIPNPESLIGVHKRYLKAENNFCKIVRSGGLPSFLEIIAVEKTPEHPDCYHVLIKLITGRIHQIRVMLAGLGLPLCGDSLYNPDSKRRNFYLESIILSFYDTEGKRRTFFLEDNLSRDLIGVKMLKKVESVTLITTG